MERLQELTFARMKPQPLPSNNKMFLLIISEGRLNKYSQQCISMPYKSLESLVQWKFCQDIMTNMV